MLIGLLELAVDLLVAPFDGAKEQESYSSLVSDVVEYLGAMCTREGSTVLPEPGSEEAAFLRFEKLSKEEMKYFVQGMFERYNCAESALVNAVLYMHRAEHNNPALRVNQFNVVLLFTLALTLSAKFGEDLVYENVYYAKLSEMPIAEFNSLEVQLLKSLDYRLMVSTEEYKSFASYLKGY